VEKAQVQGAAESDKKAAEKPQEDEGGVKPEAGEAKGAEEAAKEE